MKTASFSNTFASLALSTLLTSSSVLAAPINVDTGAAGLQLTLNINMGGTTSSRGRSRRTTTLCFQLASIYRRGSRKRRQRYEATGGLAGATGEFNFGIHAALNMICYNITLHNFQGEFSSPATTATHIHEAALGASGPPRISFPNPTPVNGDLALMNSAGCLKGPFLTGVMVDGVDSGEGFTVDKIEVNPSAFMADTHSSLALAGAVRGQLS